MKKLILTLVILTFISCKKEGKEIAYTDTTAEKHNNLYGFWVGQSTVEQQNDNDNAEEFDYSNKLNIVIKKIAGSTVLGQTVIAGEARPLSGKMTSGNDGELIFSLKEPGSNKNDGVYEFSIKNDTLSGEWIANNKNAGALKRTFKLVKQKFKYNPNLMLPKEEDYDQYIDYYTSFQKDTIYIEEEDGPNNQKKGDTVKYKREQNRYASNIVNKINASTTQLQEEDIKNLKKLEIEIIRNTIFARHGYAFKKKAIRQFFDFVPWYVPISNDVTKELTSTEKYNIILLGRFEKYATDNYDTFGR